MKYKGEYLFLQRGKTVWRSKGAAKNALRVKDYYIYNRIMRDAFSQLTWQDAVKFKEEFIKELYNSIEFEEVK